MDSVEMYALKLAALLHDPPWKPWTVTGRHDDLTESILSAVPGAREELDSCNLAEDMSVHEREAVALAAALAAELRGTGAYMVAHRALQLLCSRDQRVKRADVLASSFDRLLVYALNSVIEKRTGSKIKSNVLRFKNPFNPSYVSDVDAAKVTSKSIIGYVKRLADEVARAARHVKAEEQARLLPHIVLAFMEQLWYEMFPGAAPPADTRVPSHTVFDHQVAAAAMINWVSTGKELNGCLVVVDLASVQSWISEARRLRDAWAASWLASWLAWETVKPLVEEYGPDILLQPPARLNPFYTAWLLGKGIHDCCNTARSLESLVLPLGWPVDPVTPSRITLILPPEACRRLQEELWNNYKAAWRKILKKLEEYLNAFYTTISDVVREKLDSGNELLQQLTRMVEEGKAGGNLAALLILLEKWSEIKDSLNGLEPPLPLRVIVVDAGEAYREYREGFLGKVKAVTEERLDRLKGLAVDDTSLLKDAVKSIGDELFYHYLLRIAMPRRESLVSGFKLSRRSGPGYAEYARRVYEAYQSASKELRTAVRLCTVCGRAPAVVAVPEVVDSEPLRNLAIRLFERRGAGKSAWKVFQEVEGERLCPYCLAKRLLRTMLIDDGNFAEELVGLKLGSNILADRISGSVDMYTSRLRLNAEKLAEALKEFVDKLSPEDVIKLISLVKAGLLSPTHGSWLYFIEKDNLHDEIKDKLGRKLRSVKLDKAESYVEELTKALEATAPVILVDRGLARDLSGSDDVGKELVKTIEAAAKEGGAYYALVVADGDYMGSGILAGKLGIKPWEYIERLSGDVLPKRYWKLLAHLHEAVVAAVDGLTASGGCKGCECEAAGRKRLTTIVTPSYSYTVSRALAASSYADRSIVVEELKGFLVYAGGDDLLAVLPPASREGGKLRFNALEAAYETRRSYWGLRSRPHGFHAVGGALVPAIAAAGRSTTVYYARAKTPLWLSIRTAHSILDEKDLAGFQYSMVLRHKPPCNEQAKACNTTVCKDVLAVAIEPGEKALLPLAPLNNRDSNKGEDAGESRQVAAIVLAVKTLLEAIEDGYVSTSLLGDLLSETRLIEKLAEKNTDALMKLVGSIVERNLAVKGKKLLQELLRRGERDRLPEELLSKLYGGEELRACMERLSKVSLISYYAERGECRCSFTPVLLELFKSAKITRTARR